MIKQIIISLFTISCRLKKIETHNILLKIDCSSLHAPIFMPLTLLDAPFHRHLHVWMLQYSCSHPHATIFREIYYPKTNMKKILNPLFTILFKLKKIECHIFLQYRLLQSAWSHINVPHPFGRSVLSACSCQHDQVCMLPSTCFCPKTNI